MLSFVLAASLFGVEVEPPPLDAASMRALIADVQSLKARVATLEANCQCNAAGVKAVPVAASVAAPVQYCDANGCRLLPALTASGQPTYYTPNQLGGPSFGEGGSCATGSCSSGACANGSCGQSSGRRGFFRRR